MQSGGCLWECCRTWICSLEKHRRRSRRQIVLRYWNILWKTRRFPFCQKSTKTVQYSSWRFSSQAELQSIRRRLDGKICKWRTKNNLKPTLCSPASSGTSSIFRLRCHSTHLCISYTLLLTLQLLEVASWKRSYDVRYDATELDCGRERSVLLGCWEICWRDRIFHHIDLVFFGSQRKNLILRNHDFSEESLP